MRVIAFVSLSIVLATCAPATEELEPETESEVNSPAQLELSDVVREDCVAAGVLSKEVPPAPVFRTVPRSPTGRTPDPSLLLPSTRAGVLFSSLSRDGREPPAGTYETSSVQRLAVNGTEDAVLMPANEPAITAFEATECWFRANFDQFLPELMVSPEQVEVSGDWAPDQGRYRVRLTPKGGGEPMQDQGNYLVILQKHPRGSWGIVGLDIWNSNNRKF